MTDIRVTVPKSKKVVKVTVTQSNTGQLISSQPVTVTSLAAAPSRMDTLRDVDASSEIEGGVPVYHAANDTYVTEVLNLGDIGNIEEIDGGSF